MRGIERKMIFKITIIKHVKEVYIIEADNREVAHEKALEKIRQDKERKNIVAYWVQNIEEEE
jgi:hypothetical protein